MLISHSSADQPGGENAASWASIICLAGQLMPLHPETNKACTLCFLFFFTSPNHYNTHKPQGEPKYK